MSDEFQSHQPIKPEDFNSFGVAQVNYGPGDDRLLVAFLRKSVLNANRSKAEGKPIYEGKDYIKIQQPGEKLNIIEREASEFDKARFARQWMQYQKGMQQIPDGIPLSVLFPDKPEIVDMLRTNGVHTVEQLAHLSAHGMSTVGMGAQEWVNKAQAYLKQAEKGVDYHRFEKAIKEKDTKIEALERQIQDMAARFAQITSQSQQRPVPVQPFVSPPPQNFDYQASMIENTLQPQVPQAPVEFSQTVAADKPKRGRPKGSKNKPKEN